MKFILATIIGIIIGGSVALMTAPKYETPFIADLRLMVKTLGR